MFGLQLSAIAFGINRGYGGLRRAVIVLEALALAGQRGVLARGWGGLAPSTLSETVFALDDAPHDWLFPQTAAVVHHGGSGSTAAGLRAGHAYGVFSAPASAPTARAKLSAALRVSRNEPAIVETIIGSGLLVFVDSSPQHEPNCGSGPSDGHVERIPGDAQ